MSALTIVVLAVGVPAGWLLHSWWWPYKRCPACAGRAKRGLGSRSDWRWYNRCARCKGNAELVRAGARLISKATGSPVRGSKEK